VTGAGTGIGKEIARAFAANGDHVVVCGRHMESLEETAREIAGFEEQVCCQVCDVSDESSVVQLVEETLARFGRIDVLVNNAGIYGPIGLAHENPADEWLETLEINLFGVFLTTRHVVPVMVRNGGGAIINLSGGGATSPKPRYSAYATAKAGVVRFTEIVAHELAEQGVRVNAIAPGFIATRLHDRTLAAGDDAGPDLEQVRAKLKTGGDDPVKTAELALFLAGPDAEGITGKLFSAIWDDWRKPEVQAALRGASDLYTLRRIDDVMFKKVSG
jgi:3-oxoacyl-[acyl-carrier protein] reductase